MQWYDRIRQVKFLLVIMAIVIAVGSLIISNYLVRDLALGEHQNMEVWAEAMRTLNNADENTLLPSLRTFTRLTHIKQTTISYDRLFKCKHVIKLADSSFGKSI